MDICIKTGRIAVIVRKRECEKQPDEKMT